MAVTIDLAAGTCACPGGHQTADLRALKWGGGLFHFPAAVCGACPLRAQCVKGARGRTIRVHPQERLLQAARARQASPLGRDDRARRQAVEHRIARLVQLGIRQARYVGRTKTLFQLLMVATVANLTLLTSVAGPDGAAAGATVAAAGLLSALFVVLLTQSGANRFVPPGGALERPNNLYSAHTPWQVFPLPAVIRIPGSRPGF